MSSKLKFENGKLIATAQHVIDGDADGKPAVTVNVSLEINPVEAIGEIAKKDFAALEAIVAELKPVTLAE